MYANLAAFAVVVLVIAIWTTDRAVLIPAPGAGLGVVKDEAEGAPVS